MSLSLDDELSELERRLLDAHIGRCAGCHAFAADMTGIVEGLRTTPLMPVTISASALASSRWWRRTNVPVRVAGRVAAVAAAAAAGLAMFSLGAESVAPVAPERVIPPIIVDATSLTDTMEEIDQFRDARRAQLLSVDPQPANGETHSGTQPL